MKPPSRLQRVHRFVAAYRRKTAGKLCASAHKRRCTSHKRRCTLTCWTPLPGNKVCHQALTHNLPVKRIIHHRRLWTGSTAPGNESQFLTGEGLDAILPSMLNHWPGVEAKTTS